MQATRPAIALTVCCLIALAIWRFFVASALPFSIDEAYYVAWSKTPDWGYWTKPPFIAWAIVLHDGFVVSRQVVCAALLY
jgi:hypothetical protein